MEYDEDKVVLMAKIDREAILEQINRLERQISDLRLYSPSKTMEKEFRRMFGFDWKKQQLELLEKFKEQQNLEIKAIAGWKSAIKKLKQKLKPRKTK